MIHRAGLGIACIVGAATFYGIVPNFARAAYLNGVPPLESTLFRTVLLALIFSILALFQNQRLSIPRQALPSFALQTLATLLVSIGYLTSVQFIPVGVAVMIFFFFPVLIVMFSPVIEGRIPSLLQIGVAIVAFCGLVIAIGPSLHGLDMRGVLLAAVASGGGALQAFSGRAISRYMAPSVFGSLVHAFMVPVLLTLVFIVGDGSLQALPGGTANHAGIAFMTALGGVYVIAYMLHMLSLRYAPASTVAPYFNLEPVVTTALAASVLGERLQVNQYAGGSLILSALLAMNLIGKPKS